MMNGAHQLKSLVLLQGKKRGDNNLSRSIQINEWPATRNQAPSGLISILKRRTEQPQHRENYGSYQCISSKLRNILILPKQYPLGEEEQMSSSKDAQMSQASFSD
jgi:hypothetical protein